MELKKNNGDLTSEERGEMIKKAISMMVEFNDPKKPYLLTEFKPTTYTQPKMSKADPKVVEVPKDIIGGVIDKFKTHGWYVSDDRRSGNYQVLSRRLAYEGDYK